MTPYEDYKNRVQFKGKTKREYVKTKVKESIESLINDSQYGFTISIGENEFDVAILSTKTTQEYEAANVIAPLEVGLEKGVVFDWDDNEWIVLKKMFRPDQPGFNGIAYRCTGELKWIDEDDQHLYSQPAYIRSGRITNALGVTPDVNRVFDNLVLHDTDWNMMAATPQNLDLHPEMRFIIKGQAYRITNVDNVSIDNVSIISFENDKLLDTDDLVNGIAYSNDYEYTFQTIFEDGISIYADDIVQVPIVVLKEGIQVEEDVYLESSDDKIVEVSGDSIIGRGLGTATITVYLGKNDTIKTSFTVTVGDEHTEHERMLFIEGNDYIEWNGTEEYKLCDGRAAAFEVEVMSKIRKEIEFTDNSVKISIKDKYSGTIIVSCETEQGHVEKTVYIRTV